MAKLEKPDYGNWMPFRMVMISLALFCIFCLVAIFVAVPAVRVIFIILSVLIGIFTVYFACAFWLIQKGDGEIQRRICNALVDTMPWNGNGKALDIGTGSGRIAIAIARKFPSSVVTGVDPWKGIWEYSANVCKRNAELEGVADRVEFKIGSATGLPFEDGEFDLVTSNYVFHAVKILNSSRIDLIKEALRVLKDGGVFAFQDLFNNQFYENTDNLVEDLKALGLKEVKVADTLEMVHIPLALKLDHMVGGSKILYGIK
ncbi:MAG: methyltransferase domain-containing protein [Dehalococcoidales bacterium]|nr:methyltransferase domain-containing protein [Dehalococcoidales bacterium]